MNSVWKSNIGEYFSKKGVFRLKFLNGLLYDHCKEYVKYVGEFHGISASVVLVKTGIQDVSGCLIYINMDFLDPIRRENSGFVMNIWYNDEARLYMKYSIFFKWGLCIKSSLISDNREKDFHEYLEEELSEPEIIEKEYIFQLINARLINYIEKMQNK
jgi:hypothetical protein